MASPSSAFAKRQRLLSPAQFRSVFREGRKSRDALMGVFVAPNALDFARLGIAVSRRVSPRATVRNRIRRQIRETFRHRQHELAGLDIVVVAQPACAEQTTARLRASLERHWNRISLQCKSV